VVEVVAGQPPARDRSPSWKPGHPAPNHAGSVGWFKKLYTEALRLYRAGYNVVPVDHEKKPLCSWSSRERVEPGKLRELLEKATGIAVIAGPENPWKPVAELIILDIDDPSVVEKSQRLRELLDSTVVWRTGPRCPKCRNKHLEALEPGRRFKCSGDVRGRPVGCGLEFTVEDAKWGLGALALVDAGVTRELLGGGTVRLGPVEILVNNYQLIPPSLHPTGVRYEWVRPPDLSQPNHGIASLWKEDLKALLEELRGLAGGSELREAKPIEGAEVEPKTQQPKVEAEARLVEPEQPRAGRALSEEELKRIRDLILEYYVPGHRDRIAFSLLGLLLKAGVSYESSRRLVELITTEAGDEEARQRLYLVDYHYNKRASVLGVERLKGVTGLKEELEAVLRERGLGEDEIARRVSETISEIYSMLGVSRAPSVAWLKRKDNIVLEWVYAGRRGIYLFKRKSREDSPIIQVISNAVARKVSEIKVLGLNLRNLYKVYLDGEVVTGTVDEVVEQIEEYYGVERGARYPVARLIQSMAEETEELFYSPGPWAIDGRLVFAREPGYTPPWKPYLVWRPPEEDVSVELKREALGAVKRLVESYRNPAKPSLVLSYAAIAPIAHYVKRVLNIAFHMLVHGLEDTGKSVLLDTLKLLFSLEDNSFHPIPSSDFQARLCLSLSTLPAIVDEINELVEGYKNGDRNAVGALDVLHRAATQEQLRVSGGHQYAGYYLAVRVIIAAANTDISMVPWQLDKFILVEISPDDMIDVSKAVGATPRTMKPEVKAALGVLGVELLREVEKLIPEVEALRSLPRDEIRSKLVELGYRAWVNLYRRYGLEPFPAPAQPETSLEKASIKEQYRDIFKSYLGLAKDGRLKDVTIPVAGPKDLEDKAVLRDLETYHALMIVDKVTGKRELLCKTTFITKFGEYVTKEYGLPKVGYKRLAELLGLRRTRRTVGGVTIDNLYTLELED
jgi:hypothetical protein